ncbi:MAG: hypothetical protein ACJ0BG_02135 [Dehalococcoidia bacterium]|tara:strand:+ start:1954 stop:2139 length:186 start_codon:yes stop_codon:yes gene_type:complete
MPFLFTVLAHHSEPGDPDLMSWLIDTIKHLIGGDSTLALLVLFLVIIAVPLAIVVAYKLFF